MNTPTKSASAAKGAVRRGNAPSVTGIWLLDKLIHVSPATTVVMFAPVAVVATVISVGRGGGWSLLGWGLASTTSTGPCPNTGATGSSCTTNPSAASAPSCTTSCTVSTTSTRRTPAVPSSAPC